MLTLPYLRDVCERAVSTAAQALLSAWAVGAFNVLDVDWRAALGVASGAAVLSILKSLVAANVGDLGSASLVSTPGRHAQEPLIVDPVAGGRHEMGDRE